MAARFFKKSQYPDMYKVQSQSRNIGCNVGTLSLAILVLFIASIVFGPMYNNWVYFISAEAQIQQLRYDLEKLDGQSISEDVIGQATEWNQKIAEQQRWNLIPVYQLYIPNGWDNIEPLPIPEN